MSRQNDDALEEIFNANSGSIDSWPPIVPEQQINLLKDFYAKRAANNDMVEVGDCD